MAIGGNKLIAVLDTYTGEVLRTIRGHCVGEAGALGERCPVAAAVFLPYVSAATNRSEVAESEGDSSC